MITDLTDRLQHEARSIGSEEGLASKVSVVIADCQMEEQMG